MNSQTTLRVCFFLLRAIRRTRGWGGTGKRRQEFINWGSNSSSKSGQALRYSVFMKKFGEKRRKASENCSEILKYPPPILAVCKFF